MKTEIEYDQNHSCKELGNKHSATLQRLAAAVTLYLHSVWGQFIENFMSVRPMVVEIFQRGSK